MTTNRRIGTTQTPTADPIEATLTIQSNLKEPTQHGEHGNKVNDTETVPIRNGCISVSLYHLTLPALVDTGASVTCIGEKLFQSLSRSHTIVTKQIRMKIFLADGGVRHVRKSAKLQFKIGNTPFKHDFVILPTISEPLILGTDFLRKAKSKISFAEDLTQENKPVRAIKSITIPPFSETCLTGEITCTDSLSNIPGVTENFKTPQNRPFLVQRALVNPNCQNRHPLVLLNTTSSNIKIHKGQIVALFQKSHENDFVEPPTRYTSDHETEYIPQSINAMKESVAHDAEIDQFPQTESSITLTMQEQERLDNLLKEYEDIFVGKDGQIGLTNLYDHTIELKPDAVPCHFLPYRMAPDKARLMEETCQEYVKQGILEETTSGPWASRAFLLQKYDADGNKSGVRLISDFRHLNTSIIKQSLGSPRADTSLEMIGHLKPAIFSKLDAQQGFFQIPLSEASRDSTAFLTPNAKYRYKVMPQGLATSPQAFCALVTMILNKLKYKCAIPYLDDILILSQNKEDHFRDLQDVFESLRYGNLKLKPSKCEYFMDKIDFLGMVVTPKGLQPCPKKVQVIKTFPTPKTVKQVRSFNGMCQFYKKFIKDFATLAKPLYRLTEDKVKFHWTEECDRNFNQLKNALCKHALLHYPNFEKEFILATDASGISVGSTLSQKDESGILRPVAFAGRCLKKHEKNYSATERELLGVVYSVLHFRHYLEGRHFQLYTDHAALIPLLTKKDNQHRWARWALDIQQFSFTITHVAGKSKLMNGPDTLSRRPYPDQPGLTNPPPPAPKIKVSKRIQLRKEPNVQYFEDEELPVQIIRHETKPKSILKEPTHFHYCDCEETYTEKAGDKSYVPVQTNTLDITAASNVDFKCTKMTRTKPKHKVQSLTIQEDETEKAPNKPIPQFKEGSTQTKSESLNENEMRQNVCSTKVESKKKQEKQPKPKQTKLNQTPKAKRTTAQDPINIGQQSKSQAENIIQFLNSLPNNEFNIVNLKREQRQSEEIRDIIKYLETDTLPENKSYASQIMNKSKDFLLIENILVHINHRLWKKFGDISLQLVIPETWVRKTLSHFHDDPLAGHLGAVKMLSAMAPRVYWKSMTSDVQKFVNTCNTCMKAKRAIRNRTIPMTLHTPAPFIFSEWNLDAIGPLPETPEGNKYIQVAIDRFSRFCVAYPTADLTAHRTAYEFVKNVVCQHGVPSSIQTDNGTSYTGKEFKEMCQKYNIKHITSSPYRPQSNGLVERNNKTIGNALRSYCMGNQETWDLYLPSIVFSMNNTENRSTGYSPFFLTYGRNPKTVIDGIINLGDKEKNILQSVTDMILAQDLAWETSQNNLKLAEKDMKTRYDSKAIQSPIMKADIVYLQIPNLLKQGTSKKLQPIFSGPYLVCKRPNIHTATLRDIKTGKLLTRNVHVDRLKRITDIRNNKFAGRLIRPDNDQLKKMWKINDKEIKATEQLLRTDNKIQARPTHSKVKRRSKRGQKSA